MNEIKISAVIFDLDGTLLDTESSTKNVLKDFLEKYGVQLDPKKEEKRIGKMFKESAAAIVNDYELPINSEEFAAEIMPLYQESARWFVDEISLLAQASRWNQARVLPGVNRLLRHLHKHGIPFALASNSIIKHIGMKISHQQGWKEMFSVILGGDEVANGKPSPDIFIEAAKRLGMDTSNCLVIEDSPVGVRAAKSSGAQVVAVPSIRNQDEHYVIADYKLHSLLEFQPDIWGLPPFDDWIENALPIEPLHITGSLDDMAAHDGYTSLDMISENNLYATLHDQVSGVFFGWTKLQKQGIFKAVVGIGWDYSSGISTRKIHTRLFGDISNCKSKENFQMVLVGYVRKLSKEEQSLRKEDENIAESALDHSIFSQHLSSSYLSESIFGDEAWCKLSNE